MDSAVCPILQERAPAGLRAAFIPGHAVQLDSPSSAMSRAAAALRAHTRVPFAELFDGAPDSDVQVHARQWPEHRPGGAAVALGTGLWHFAGRRFAPAGPVRRRWPADLF